MYVIAIMLCLFTLFGCDQKGAENTKQNDEDSALQKEFRNIHGNRLLPTDPNTPADRKKKN